MGDFRQLGATLRKLRQDAGLTVRDAAERLKKSPGYLSRVEARGEMPSPELLCDLAALYSTDIEELLDLARKDRLDSLREQLDEQRTETLKLFRKKRR